MCCDCFLQIPLDAVFTGVVERWEVMGRTGGGREGWVVCSLCFFLRCLIHNDVKVAHNDVKVAELCVIRWWHVSSTPSLDNITNERVGQRGGVRFRVNRDCRWESTARFY